jgi:hypothetical protein
MNIFPHFRSGKILCKVDSVVRLIPLEFDCQGCQVSINGVHGFYWPVKLGVLLVRCELKHLLLLVGRADCSLVVFERIWL